MSTLPFGSSVAVWEVRTVLIDAVVLNEGSTTSGKVSSPLSVSRIVRGIVPSPRVHRAAVSERPPDASTTHGRSICSDGVDASHFPDNTGEAEATGPGCTNRIAPSCITTPATLDI